MPFHLRKRVKIGPVYAWFSLKALMDWFRHRQGVPGFTSWGLTSGRVSRNMTRGQTTVDTPGPGYYQTKAKRSRRRHARRRAP